MTTDNTIHDGFTAPELYRFFAILNKHSFDAALRARSSGIDAADAGGYTLLMHAVARGRLKAAAWLLDAGASPAAVAADGHDALSLAYANARWAIVPRLEAAGLSPLRNAANVAEAVRVILEHDRVDILRRLVDQGADLHRVEQDIDCPLVLGAVARTARGCLRLLLEMGFPADECGKYRYTPLQVAANMLRSDLMWHLIAHGADTQVLTSAGKSLEEVVRTASLPEQADYDEKFREFCEEERQECLSLILPDTDEEDGE